MSTDVVEQLNGRLTNMLDLYFQSYFIGSQIQVIQLRNTYVIRSFSR